MASVYMDGPNPPGGWSGNNPEHRAVAEREAKPERWYARDGCGGQGLIASDRDGRTVAVAYRAEDGPMLAAGPELVAALRDLVETFHREAPRCSRGYTRAAREAIYNATGRHE